MVRSLKRILPWVALISAGVLAVCSILFGGQRAAMLVDTGETRVTVERNLAPLLALNPETAEDPALRSAAEAAATSPYVASFWLFAPDGQVLYSRGSTAFQGRAEDRLTVETRRLLESVPAEALDADQRMLLTVASAIQAEGEHNDIYRHLVRPVRNGQGQRVAWIGAAYEVSPQLGNPVDSVALLLLGSLLGLAGYWLSLPLWVFWDARERGERAWAWAIFILIGNLVALLAYLLVRVPPVAGGGK